jgi:hypothetical protein
VLYKLGKTRQRDPDTHWPRNQCAPVHAVPVPVDAARAAVVQIRQYQEALAQEEVVGVHDAHYRPDEDTIALGTVVNFLAPLSSCQGCMVNKTRHIRSIPRQMVK